MMIVVKRVVSLLSAEQSHQTCKGDGLACFARSVAEQVWLGSLLAHMGVPLWRFDGCFGLIQQIGLPAELVCSNA